MFDIKVLKRDVRIPPFPPQSAMNRFVHRAFFCVLKKCPIILGQSEKRNSPKTKLQIMPSLFILNVVKNLFTQADSMMQTLSDSSLRYQWRIAPFPLALFTPPPKGPPPLRQERSLNSPAIMQAEVFKAVPLS